MKKLYEKYKNKLVRLSDDVVGTVIGYGSEHLILLLEEGVEPIYSFSLDDLAEEDFFIDFELLNNCETCLLTWADESNILHGKKRSLKNDL
jgi:hypothetical protein